ncbi:hypothetical protein [Novosphingobium sp. FKTRR1]|uniref:hypothetical protein n=1 Tax=unclassified Novosphingobium TaxID=2644732 RepID=UPI001CF07064|nr:hypothetical protein [Novosphingobium sp. FKTRR1]
MRADAKALLDRLGKSDFKYREFVDRFADLESWPIFEAVLRDSRLLGSVPDDLDNDVDDAGLHEHGGELIQPAKAQLRPDLFARYASSDKVPSAPEPQRNIRSLLERLSHAVEEGEL